MATEAALMDTVTRKKRSQMMAGIKNKNTQPELVVRKLLYAKGFRYRLHRKSLPGTPDIVLTGRRIAIFVHGCFWHRHSGCKFATMPKSNIDFWTNKLLLNVERDAENRRKLIGAGWRVLVVWECATLEKTKNRLLAPLLTNWIEGNELNGEIPPMFFALN